MSMFKWHVEANEFNAFKEKITNEIKSLREEIQRKATDSEEIAKNAAINATASAEKVKSTEKDILEALKNLEEYKNQAFIELQSIQSEKTKLETSSNTLLKKIEECKLLQDFLENSQTEASNTVDNISKNAEKIEEALADAQNLPDAVETTNKLAESAQETSKKLQDLLTHSMRKKAEIDEIHKEIYGFDLKNEDDEIEHIDGLKDFLESSYNKIKSNTEDLSKKIDITTKEITNNHKKDLHEQSESFKQLLNDSELKINATHEKLAALLPGAMATGLSAAYENKKDDETTLLNKLEQTFRYSILGLISISAIPFFIDIYLIIEKGKDILQIINETPKMILSILPIYFPVLWLAYSTNKKVNLSKRLIEEYTHKAVLGNTYSGLSNQIETLKNEEKVKQDLRTRLLFNVLQVSAENPGKLITNYNKADHPLMEALENSAKLSDSVVALSKIPGLSALAKKLTEKGEDIFKEQQQKVEQGFAAQDTLESKEEPQKEQST